MKDTLPKNIRGDLPCADCGTEDNIVWFTDNLIWNHVIGRETSPILCINCFVIRAEKKIKCTGWKLIPENATLLK